MFRALAPPQPALLGSWQRGSFTVAPGQGQSPAPSGVACTEHLLECLGLDSGFPDLPSRRPWSQYPPCPPGGAQRKAGSPGTRA